MTFVDAHSHLADPRLENFQDQLLAKCQAARITTLIQGGVDRLDWQRQIELRANGKSLGLQIIPCFGIHPYTVAALHEAHQDYELELDHLSRLMAEQTKRQEAFALGELGLDFRPHIAKGSEELQKEVLRAQLELGVFLQKPIVIHCVRAHDEFLQCLHLGIDNAPGQKIKGMVHAFNGNENQAQDFLDQGLLLSVGGALCRPDNERLRQAVLRIPLEKLCLESDSPDQKPPDWPEEFSDPTLILSVAQQVAKLKKCSADEVLDKCSANARQLFLS
jgi:TatD DNase family protein